MFGSPENLSQSADSTGLKQKQDTISLLKLDFVASPDSLFIKSPGQGIVRMQINGTDYFIPSVKDRVSFPLDIVEGGKLFLFRTGEGYSLKHISKNKGQIQIKSIPFYMSVLPPLVAILCALILKEVLISLFLGIWVGVFILSGFRIDSVFQFILTFWEVIQVHVVNALMDTGHISIIVFSMLIGGMVALISKNGGMAGVVDKLSVYAKDAKSSQFITWLLGIMVFFDDYANTLVVGNTMRPITDKFKVSREKLSYLVDSTAAPVAAVAFITTWIGAQLAYIQSGIQNIEEAASYSAYGFYFNSLQFAFYPFLTIIFLYLIISSGRDYGPMLAAEKRARLGNVESLSQQRSDEPNMEDLQPVQGAKLHWMKAALPVLTVVVITLFALVETGFSALFKEYFPSGGVYSWSLVWNHLDQVLAEGQGAFVKLGKIIGSADSYISLLWASASGLFVAVVITLADKSMNLFNTMHWVTAGFKTMLPALLILILAWALASVTNELHTAEFISQGIVGNIAPFLMPLLVFILAFLVAFSTGSSWSTMAILYPIAIPATYAVCMDSGMNFEQTLPYLSHVISVVLAAAVFGDHCSPISDTTILSSLASNCNHLDHVKTQMPYAVTVGITSMFLSLISAWLNFGLWFNLFLFVVGTLILYFVIRVIGTKVSEE